MHSKRTNPTIVAYTAAIALPVFPIYIFLFDLRPVVLVAALGVSLTTGLVTRYTKSLRAYLPRAERALPGWRGILSVVQLPSTLVALVAALARTSASEFRAEGWWFGLLIAANFLGNPVQVLFSEEDRPFTKVIPVAVPWLVAWLAAAMQAVAPVARRDWSALAIFGLALCLAALLFLTELRRLSRKVPPVAG